MAALVPGFTILQHLGRGAGSHIFRAKDVTTGQEVALKRILRRSAEDDKYLAQTEHEYEIARRLDHPNLRRCLQIRVVQEGRTVREILLVMELVRGRTLERLRPRDPLQAVKVFRGIACGLEALHAIGLVHCDVTPRNIMVNLHGDVKLIDFGQTCPIGTVKDRVQGTPDFLAPEQVRLEPLDQQTDLFGLGATMYWALTGHGLPTPMPSAGDPWPRTNGSLLNWPGPPPPAKVDDTIPVALSDLVMAACQERRCDRPADMSTLLKRLEALAEAWHIPKSAGGPDESSSGEPTKLARSP